MNIFCKIFIPIFILSGIFQLNAKEVVVTPSSGERFVLDVEPATPFLEVIEQIENNLVDQKLAQEEEIINPDENNEISFSYSFGFPTIFVKKVKQKGPRNYGAVVASSEKENIRFIIRSLAKHNWAQLAKEEASLKKAGDKINHIHPFRFLQSVFTDEELKVGLFVIRNKSLVWGEYYEGLKKSLNDESDLNNLVHFTSDFANNVGINVNVILPYVQTRQWNALIDTLINSIPRDGNPHRYDM